MEREYGEIVKPRAPSPPIDLSESLSAKRAGLKNIRFHDLRHTFITNMARENIPIPTIMELAGHRNIRTTLRYVNLFEKEK